MKRRFYSPSRRFKLRESIRSKRINRRLNEYKRWGNGPGFITRYEGVLRGLDILHFDGYDYIETLVDDENWWNELCQINNWDYNQKLDRNYNSPEDEDYDPNFPLYSEYDINSEKRSIALDMLDDDIMNVDSTIDSMDIYDIVKKYFDEEEWVSAINGYDPRNGDPIFGFSLFTEYGDHRGNRVEWVFNEEFLDKVLEQLVEDFNYSESEARRKIFNCCKEITDRVKNSVYVELSDYVPF